MTLYEPDGQKAEKNYFGPVKWLYYQFSNKVPVDQVQVLMWKSQWSSEKNTFKTMEKRESIIRGPCQVQSGNLEQVLSCLVLELAQGLPIWCWLYKI